MVPLSTQKDVFETNPQNRNFNKTKSPTDRWVRPKLGYIAGVCECVANAIQIPPWVVRIFWLFATFFSFGVSVFVYIFMAFCLPREDRIQEAYQPRFAGVCFELSQRSGIEVGLVRFFMLLAIFASLGITLIGYLILYFIFRFDD